MKSELQKNQTVAAEIIQDNVAAANLDGLSLRIALQVAPRGWTRSLRSMIELTQRGVPLEDAFRRIERGMPADLRALLLSSLQLPEPTRFLIDAIIARRNAQEVRRQLVFLLVYPLLMLLFAASICFFVTNILHVLLTEGIGDFGLTGIDQSLAYIQDQRMALMALLGMLIWCAAVALTLHLVGPRWAGIAVVGGLPMYGKPLRWIHLHELVYRLGLANSQNRDSAVATAVMAASFQGSSHEVVAGLLVRRMKAGASLGSALSQTMLSDGLVVPLLQSIDQSTSVSEGCDRVALALHRIVQTRCKFLSMMMPIFIISTVATFIWGTFSGYLSMMVILIRMISSLA